MLLLCTLCARLRLRLYTPSEGGVVKRPCLVTVTYVQCIVGARIGDPSQPLHTMLLRIIECPQIRLVVGMLIAVLYSLLS